MPFYHFFWIEENEEHVAEHGVSREEFEKIVSTRTLSNKVGRAIDRSPAA